MKEYRFIDRYRYMEQLTAETTWGNPIFLVRVCPKDIRNHFFDEIYSPNVKNNACCGHDKHTPRISCVLENNIGPYKRWRQLESKTRELIIKNSRNADPSAYIIYIYIYMATTTQYMERYSNVLARRKNMFLYKTGGTWDSKSRP